MASAPRGAATRVLLANGTLLQLNSAPLNGGSAAYIEDANTAVHYVLPAPLGHYITGQPCGELYADASTSSVRSPCGVQSHHASVPPMLARTLERLPAGPGDYDAYPHRCDIGRYGNRADVHDQRSTLCSGRCPAGSICPALGTIEPLSCSSGHYCPAGASAALPVCAHRLNLHSSVEFQAAPHGTFQYTRIWPRLTASPARRAVPRRPPQQRHRPPVRGPVRGLPDRTLLPQRRHQPFRVPGGPLRPGGEPDGRAVLGAVRVGALLRRGINDCDGGELRGGAVQPERGHGQQRSVHHYAQGSLQRVWR